MKKENRSLGQIVILCGGRGTRLKPMTDEVPKALVKLNGRPVLDYIIDFYCSKGFKRFVLCVGYKGEKIKSHFAHKKSDIDIQFSDAGESASMLERIYAVRDIIDNTFFVSYGDTLTDLDIDGMLVLHKKRKAAVTIVTAGIRNPFGLVTYNAKNEVISFVEKPILNYYIGSFVIERSVLDNVTAKMRNFSDGQGLVELFGSLIKQQKLMTFEHKGNQITFNTETERQKAEETIGQFYTVLEKRI